MPKEKCVFCGKEQEDFRGTYLLKNDGNVMYFSSSKCMKNHLKLKRDRRKVRWTEAFHVQRQKRYAKQEELKEKEAAKKAEKEKLEKEKLEKKVEKTKKIEKKEKKSDKKDSKKK